MAVRPARYKSADCPHCEEMRAALDRAQIDNGRLREKLMETKKPQQMTCRIKGCKNVTDYIPGAPATKLCLSCFLERFEP